MWMPPLYRDFTQQAQIDAQYGTQQWVADPAAEARHFIERSAFARERLRCTLDIPFGPTLDETLDIFPADRPDAPVFVFIHGGYWRANTSKEFSCVALGLQGCGVTTVVINYSLCPKVRIDEITRQARAAVAWVVRNIDRHGGDPRRIAVGGHSAGGHLAAMCLQTRWAEEYGLPRDPIAAAVLVSGLYDLEPLRYSYLQPLIQLDERTVQQCSPLFAVRPCATPALVTWGGAESEEFARQAASFHAAWSKAGNRSELTAQAGAHHFSAIHGFEHASSPLCQWVAGALGQR
ncbi:alpha/beta hydrolase [Variovorax saccharolyticus]|uniref:alpha/beta hydrolase n=1 Tax=Variovorax saccharolyticus TaxID=3053516 RepID=UPI0025781ABF|nr:alpha/beta hydrolase [Variovorax sp. J22R187]MDM0021487.1 alpha/beta hydrolase [Variovorax sp. J22R187]